MSDPKHAPTVPHEDPAEARRRRIAELEERKRLREQKESEEHETHKLACLELEEKLTSDHGPERRAFILVNRDNAGGVGPLAFKPAELSRWKAWKAKDGNRPEDAFALAQSALLFPDVETFGRIYHARPEILEKCIAGLAILAGFNEEQLRGKY